MRPAIRHDRCPNPTAPARPTRPSAIDDSGGGRVVVVDGVEHLVGGPGELAGDPAVLGELLHLRVDDADPGPTHLDQRHLAVVVEIQRLDLLGRRLLDIVVVPEHMALLDLALLCHEASMTAPTVAAYAREHADREDHP